MIRGYSRTKAASVPTSPGQAADLTFHLDGIRVLERPEHMGQNSFLSSMGHQ